jgi:acyl dehydratase
MTIRELHATPRLVPLFGRAVLTGFTRRGGDLPDTVYEQREVAVDAEQLAAYNKVCGFRLTDELPATYPHILSFPLQVKLMTDPGFPFPLVGSVHLANRITQTRPLRIDEKPTLRVHVSNLRTHPKGRQFDLISEALVDGAPVWTDVSTYLRRGGGSGKDVAKEERTPQEPTAIWRVADDIGRRYAEVSGDRNPIHLHPLTARLFGFPRAIAHGMWTKARCLAAFEGRLPDAYTVDVRFKLPVLLPAKVGFAAETTESGWNFQLFDARTGKPHLAGTIATAGEG